MITIWAAAIVLFLVLEAVTVDRLVTPYVPPEDAGELDPDGDNGLSKAGRNLLRCVNLYARHFRNYRNRIGEVVELKGDRMVSMQLTEDLSMDILFGEPALYPRQKAVYDAAFRGVWDDYDLIH